MSKYAFYIAYDGPALANSQMDVRELAPALLALSDLFDEANKVLNDGKATINLNVQGSFKSGCFGIDLVVFQGIAKSIFSHFSNQDPIATAAEIAGLLGISAASGVHGLMRILKWARGRKIEKVEIKDHKATIYIDDEHFETEEKIIKLLQNARIRQAIEDAITKPLEVDGIDTVGIAESADQKAPSILIIREEAGYFQTPPVEDEDLSEREYETTLQLVGLSFQENNKWRFSDGASIFHASLADPVFLKKINAHQAVFAKDDIIKAIVREQQRLTKDGIKTQRTLIKVLEHQGAVRQLRLPIIEQD